MVIAISDYLVSSYLLRLLIIGLLLLSSDAQSETLRYGDTMTINETLISSGTVFELGFFSDPFSGHYFLGIWFRNDTYKKPVWVANRDNPILSSSGVLKMDSYANLILMDSRQVAIVINSENLTKSATTKSLNSSSAVLLDSGNLVLKQGGGEIVWQSFESFEIESDTYLPGMKIGWFDLHQSQPKQRTIVSWLTATNPNRGPFTLGVCENDSTKLMVWQSYSFQVTIAHWNGKSFEFVFKNTLDGFDFSYVSNANESYFTFDTKSPYESSWLTIAPTGQLDEFALQSGGEIMVASHQSCEGGDCLSLDPMLCSSGNEFLKVEGMISGLMSTLVAMSYSDCEIMCGSNCSCIAFAARGEGEAGCQLYYGSKEDLLSMLGTGGGVVYVRGDDGKSKDRRVRRAIVASVSSFAVLVSVIAACFLIWRCKTEEGKSRILRWGRNTVDITSSMKLKMGTKKEQLPLFSFTTIETATGCFAASNKLGQGGFGSVYKGKLPGGQEIAAKRLAKDSGQGSEEFINEVMLISKLQHRNLVRLLGCCIQKGERILVYEYMPNRSLDSLIFDSTKSRLLDWSKRIRIIEGIAQGLLYLHKYSRLRIIHRDLKTENILLDDEMNPKISDFGMARIFEDHETGAKTRRIAGTYGYMSPEYAMNGVFSEKSDVFSFGVIVLEMISGRKSSSYDCGCTDHAWGMWKEGRSAELMDAAMKEALPASEAIRFVQLGLLCVQERAADRPAMSDVISMLQGNASAIMPLPREPAFLTAQLSSNSANHGSANGLTLTQLCAR